MDKEKSLFQKSFDALAEGVIILNEKEEIVFFNDKAGEFLGIEEKFLGKNIFEFFKFQKITPFFQIFSNKIFEVTEKKIATNKRLILKLNVRELKWHEEFLGYLLLFSDITRETSLEKTKEEFIKIVSHHLRTPVSALQWGIDLLLKEKTGPLNNKQKEQLEEMFRTNKKILTTIDDFIDIAKIEEGRILEKVKVFSFEAVVEYVLGLFEEQTKQKNIELDIKKTLPLQPVKMDVEKIKLVLEKLIENAIKYNIKGGKIFISFFASPEGKFIIFSIKDTGIGIPVSEQTKVFSKFFRAENAQKLVPEGIGLSLYIAKNVIEAHGGKIWFESEEGRGTTFYFTLPIIT